MHLSGKSRVTFHQLHRCCCGSRAPALCRAAAAAPQLAEEGQRLGEFLVDSLSALSLDLPPQATTSSPAPGPARPNTRRPQTRTRASCSAHLVVVLHIPTAVMARPVVHKLYAENFASLVLTLHPSHLLGITA